jgi:hypothetical protein
VLYSPKLSLRNKGFKLVKWKHYKSSSSSSKLNLLTGFIWSICILLKAISGAIFFLKCSFRVFVSHPHTSVVNVAVVAAAAELLRLAGASIDGAMLLNGNDKETMTAEGAPGEPAAERLSPALAVVQKCRALAVVLKTVLSCTSEAPCERDLTEGRKRILQHREHRTGAREFFVICLPSPLSS